MRDLFVVTKFTMKEMVKRKSFIISTIIILLLIVLGFNVPNILSKISGGETEEKLWIIDSENIFEGTLETLKNVELGYEIEIKNENIAKEDIKQKVNNDEIDSAIIIEKFQNNKIDIRYIVKNAATISGVNKTVPESIVNSLNNIYSNLQISKLGLTQEQLQSLSPNFNYTIEQTETEKAEGNVFVMLMLSLVLFYAIYFCAYQVSSAITTEKTSKIIETLVTSTEPKTIVLGKTIGIGIVGLIQLILIIGTALISAKLFLEPGLLDTLLDMKNITPYLGIITIIYFILGYSAYALLYALTGATVNKPEDIQSANTPVAIVAVIGFYLSYFTMMNPTSPLNAFAAIFPISSPFCMPFRIMMGLASTTDVIISIGILLVTILIIAKISIKIYSNAILNYGKK